MLQTKPLRQSFTEFVPQVLEAIDLQSAFHDGFPGKLVKPVKYRNLPIRFPIEHDSDLRHPYHPRGMFAVLRTLVKMSLFRSRLRSPNPSCSRTVSMKWLRLNCLDSAETILQSGKTSAKPFVRKRLRLLKSLPKLGTHCADRVGTICPP